MTTRVSIALIAIISLIFASFAIPRAHEVLVVDLAQALDGARKQPAASAFAHKSVVIDGVERPAIVAMKQTRLTFHVTLPKHARFDVALAIDPPAWNAPGAVQFMIGVFDGQAFRSIKTIVIAPHDRSSDRRWHDVTIDLEEFADLTVDLILNTRLVPGTGPDDLQAVSVWGRPQVVAR